MDSAHCDERNLAQSANGPNTRPAADSQEMVKLKEDHDRQIQEIKLNNKIQTLEMQNESKTKIMELEKDNQGLNHRLEIMTLKIQHQEDSNKMVANCEMEKEKKDFEVKLAAQKHECDAKITEKENEYQKRMDEQKQEFQVRLAEKEKEMAEQKQEFQVKLAEKENEYQKRMAEQKQEFQVKFGEKKKEMAEQKQEFQVKLDEKEKEMIAKENEHKMKILQLETANKLQISDLEKTKDGGKVESQPRFLMSDDKIVWGADQFFQGIKWDLIPFASYEEWYEYIKNILENKVPRYTSSEGRKYMLMRKDFNTQYDNLFFTSTGSNESPYCFYHVDFDKGLWNTTVFILLHPKCFEKSLEFNGFHHSGGYWNVQKVDGTFYSGTQKTATILGILNKLDRR